MSNFALKIITFERVSNAASDSRCFKVSRQMFSNFEGSLFGRYAAFDALLNVIFEKQNYKVFT
jgi:hypothetical protein